MNNFIGPDEDETATLAPNTAATDASRVSTDRYLR